MDTLPLRRHSQVGLRTLTGLWIACVWAGFACAQELQIHYINVDQGGSTLIVGLNGTTILYDFGPLDGRKRIVPYLQDVVGLSPNDGIDYAFVSHGDKDHYMGYRGVIEAGYDILKANYEPGTPKSRSTTMLSNWFNPAKGTSAGAFEPVPLGLRIKLGDDAEAIVIAANGMVIGDPASRTRSGRANAQPRFDENDRSIALFVRYGNFHYLIDGDLGSGPEKCTEHQTTQKDVQTRVAQALIDHRLISQEHGVDILHIAHHGSESSTSAKYYALMKPEVGVISVGPKQGKFLHPREDVVEKVLTCKTNDGFSPTACEGTDTRAPCARGTPPLKGLFQTDNGLKGCSTTGCTSFMGIVGGDIQIRTDGQTAYTINVTENHHQKTPSRNLATQTEWRFALDELTTFPQPNARRTTGRPR